MRFSTLFLFAMILCGALGFKAYSLYEESLDLREAIKAAELQVALSKPFTKGAGTENLQQRISSLQQRIADGEAILKQHGVDLTSSRFLPSLTDWRMESAEYFGDADVAELCHCIRNDESERFEELVAAGVDIGSAGRGGLTPLLFAYLHRKIDAFERLLDEGASPDAKLNDYVETSSQVYLWPGSSVTMCTILDNGYPSRYFKLALAKTADVNQRVYAGNTLLTHFCYRYHSLSPASQLGIMELLLQAGIDVNAQNDRGETACYIASKYHADVCQKLLDAGADPFIRANDGKHVLDRVNEILVGSEKKRNTNTYNPHRTLRARLINMQANLSNVKDRSALEEAK